MPAEICLHISAGISTNVPHEQWSTKCGIANGGGRGAADFFLTGRDYMREKKLSKRMQAVADLVTPGMRVADVGCDHAYVSIYLVEHGIASECLAMDVNAGPLERAQANIRAHGLTGKIQTRLGSGLEQARPGEVDAVLMAGMGGILVRDLLETSKVLSHSLQEWILQPQSDIDLVRRYIRESGYRIVEEDMVEEDGKYYPMFRAVPAETVPETEPVSEEWLPVFDRFGELLLTGRHPVLKEFLDQGKTHYAVILQQMEASGYEGEKREQMQLAAEYVRRALTFWE